jgi:hypothetical protein
VATVVDQSIQPLPGPAWHIADSAVVTPKPRLESPASTVTRVAIPAPRLWTLSASVADPSISKLLMERMLRYSTWSAAPPSPQGNTAADSLVSTSPVVSVQSLIAPSGSPLHQSIAFARLNTQGGQTSAHPLSMVVHA